jgi:hypothetical protein
MLLILLLVVRLLALLYLSYFLHEDLVLKSVAFSFGIDLRSSGHCISHHHYLWMKQKQQSQHYYYLFQWYHRFTNRKTYYNPTHSFPLDHHPWCHRIRSSAASTTSLRSKSTNTMAKNRNNIPRVCCLCMRKLLYFCELHRIFDWLILCTFSFTTYSCRCNS